MKVVFDHHEDTAQNIKTFWFKPSREVAYTAGQFTEIKLPHDHPDERGDKRWFTLSSSPTEELLSITTKFSSPGSSFKQTLLALKSGTELHLADPMGDFVLPKDVSIPLVFVAGGIGVTPMRSMVTWLRDSKQRRDITLLYVASSDNQLAFVPLFQKYCRYVVILTRERDGNGAELTAKRILELTKPADNAQIYLSGPEPMIEILVDQFTKTDIEKGRLVTDYFPGYEPI